MKFGEFLYIAVFSAKQNQMKWMQTKQRNFCYDISNDKLRYMLVGKLKKFLVRMQYSVLLVKVDC
jgi:hypothetical protein